MKYLQIIAAFTLILTLCSCEKSESVVDAAYLPQQVYLPAANPGNSPTGVYFVNAVAVSGQTIRYKIDLPNSKFQIPLAVYRSGVDKKGRISANLTMNTDTVAKLLLVPGKFPAGTEALPADKYTITPTVEIPDGAENGQFSIDVDLNFLRANLTKKFAVAVKVNSVQVSASSLNNAVILIDPAFLVPTANFTSSVSAKVAGFSNSSLNAVSYSWNYGDGTVLSTLKDAPHTYAASGTYVVSLTVFGPLGDINKSVKTVSVVIN